MGLRGACRVCGGGLVVLYRIVPRTPEADANVPDPLGCRGCGKPPLLYRLVERRIPAGPAQ